MKVKTPSRRFRKICLISFIVIAALLIASCVYFGIYYHADETVYASLEGNEHVQVTEIDNGYYFDGPSEDTAFIFYPGAKVETIAYAPLMLQLAEKGIDCFLVDMPFHFALLHKNAADELIKSYSYSRWIMGGHSLGGVVASMYASEHADTICGLVLLASYSTKELDDHMTVCSIYGSEDGCLNFEEYEHNKQNLPVGYKEYILEGGNHAGFGCYGKQSGDGIASLSNVEQQSITATYIADLFKN